jgi:membrane protease YdiL (CAAX protease family)
VSGTRKPLPPLVGLALYLAFVFLGGSLLAPWLYHAARGLESVIPALADPRFHRFVHRSFLGLALLGAWPLLRSQGLASFASIGLVRLRGQVRRLANGFMLGFVSLAIVASLHAVLGGRVWRTNLAAVQLGAEVGEAAAVAAVVAVLEEVLFRGVLFGVLARAMHAGAAVWGSALIYALVHFFERPASPDPIVWSSGLVLLPRMLGGFVALDGLLPSYLTLTLAGALLAQVYRRSGTLWASIGWHAGWIFWLRIYREVTRENVEAVCSLCGSARMVDGWTTCVIMALVLFAVMRRPWSQFTR